MQKFAERPTPEPELDPCGLRSSTYGIAALPAGTAPAADASEARGRRPTRSCSTCRGVSRPPRAACPRCTRPRADSSAPARAIPPSSAVLSALPMFALSSTGIPCSGPRTLPALRSASSASAIVSASGFVSITARSSGPRRLSRLDPREIELGDAAGRVAARLHRALQLVDGDLVELEVAEHSPYPRRPAPVLKITHGQRAADRDARGQQRKKVPSLHWIPQNLNLAPHCSCRASSAPVRKTARARHRRRAARLGHVVQRVVALEEQLHLLAVAEREHSVRRRLRSISGIRSKSSAETGACGARRAARHRDRRTSRGSRGTH